MKILDITGLTKSFGKKRILKDINLELSESEIVGLVGKNGAGKTTFFKTISGLYKYEKGDICFHNNIETRFIFDTPPLIKHAKIIDYLNIYSNLYCGNSIAKSDAIALLKKLNLDVNIDKRVETLSFGMKKKLYLCTLLLNRCDLVIIDEPFNGLDYEAVELLKRIVLDLSKNNRTTFLISSHQITDLYEICNRICKLEDKQMVEDGMITNKESCASKYTSVILRAASATHLMDILKTNFNYNLKIIDENTLKIYTYDETIESAKIIKLLSKKNIDFTEIYYDKSI